MPERKWAVVRYRQIKHGGFGDRELWVYHYSPEQAYKEAEMQQERHPEYFWTVEPNSAGKTS